MIQVIERALTILDFVAQHNNEPVKLINIAEHLKISQPTCSNIIKTLVSKHYLENVSRNEGYKLGSALFKLTGNLAYSDNIIDVARPVMEQITSRVNETVLLGIIKNHKRQLLHVVESDRDLTVRAKNEADIYYSASGRLLLAYLSDKEKEALIKAIGLPNDASWPEIKGRDQLFAELARIRTEGIVKTLNENHIAGFAVPVFNGAKVVAALSIFLPESRCNEKHIQNILKSLAKGAKTISSGLGQA